MKQLLILLALCFASLSANAQIKSELNETNLLGGWSTRQYVDDCDNIWPAMHDMCLSGFTFKDDGISIVHVTNRSGSTSYWIPFYGYIIGGYSLNSRPTLHFIQLVNDGPWHFDTPNQLNFVITAFDGETLTVKSYDGKHGMILHKDTSAAPTTAADAAQTPTRLYDLNGRPVSNPDAHGFFIQSDGKKILK